MRTVKIATSRSTRLFRLLVAIRQSFQGALRWSRLFETGPNRTSLTSAQACTNAVLDCLEHANSKRSNWIRKTSGLGFGSASNPWGQFSHGKWARLKFGHHDHSRAHEWRLLDESGANEWGKMSWARHHLNFAMRDYGLYRKHRKSSMSATPTRRSQNSLSECNIQKELPKSLDLWRAMNLWNDREEQQVERCW